MTKRLRVLAGPNGSGKTSVYEALCKIGHPNFGVFVNADIIEMGLKRSGYLDFRDFRIDVEEDELKKAYMTFRDAFVHGRADFFEVNDNFLVMSDKEVGDSYFACFLADFIRNRMLDTGIETFTIETVMSHPSKLDFLVKAKECGYRVYLYYVTTESPMVNVGRVAERVANGGHDVDECKIIQRYYRSLDNLFDAINLSNRAYLFDNSGRQYKFLAEYNGTSSTLHIENLDCPAWLKTYVLDKVVL